MALLMPVSAWIAAGMLHSGLTRELHSLTRAPSSMRTIPTSVTRSARAAVPVVSRSTKAIAGANTGSQLLTSERSFVSLHPYVERSFLPLGAAGLLRASPCAPVLRVDWQPFGAAVQIVGGRVGGEAQARRVRGIDAGSALGADAALLRAAARRLSCPRRATQSDRRCADRRADAGRLPDRAAFANGAGAGQGRFDAGRGNSRRRSRRRREAQRGATRRHRRRHRRQSIYAQAPRS